MTHGIRAKRALAHLGDEDRALAVLALWCRHRDDEGPTRTAGNTIVYGPSFESFGLAEQVGVLAHHVLHVALQHSDRQAVLAERLGEGFDPTLFGLAADGLINETLLLAGHAVPRPAVLATELLETIGESVVSGMQAVSDWDVDRLAMALHSNPKSAENARRYGETRSFQQDIETGKSAEEDDAPSPAEWRNQMLRALEAGRAAGSGIGRFGAILADLAPPQIAWEVHMRRLLTIALSDTPQVSYRRPTSRWVAASSHARNTATPEPAFQPGRTRNGLRPRVVVGLDTSSSIGATEFSLFCSETEGVSRRSGAEVHLLAFDEDVHDSRRMDTGAWQSLRKRPPRTGGGTNYAPVMEAAARLRPSILVMLTDLDAPLGQAPPFPVLWAVPGRGTIDAAFGHVLRIDG